MRSRYRWYLDEFFENPDRKDTEMAEKRDSEQALATIIGSYV